MAFLIFFVFLCSIPFIGVPGTPDSNALKWFWIFYLIILFGFQSILEWKYLKNSKQYVTTLIFLLLGVIIIYYMEYFFS
ncbi:DUF4181 domain-containing protein [Rossellomorea yichunensis]|uniref:DUF4181 domain-containing protein n=1 Tax=Rossellomorea yichunensis TaxID=3077331 RepID=UPI0028DD770E|nr:DUF4181 domain-containing protein [Rossellomorea sp. YC4-1]MDT9027455.1 DUF4181 domain-containing protein [Rossellomorea sp. YC4-1]